MRKTKAKRVQGAGPNPHSKQSGIKGSKLSLSDAKQTDLATQLELLCIDLREIIYT